MQPPYSPNVVNQTVDYDGAKWQGQPGQGWVQIGGPGASGASGGDALQNAKDYATWAQAQQIAANQPAIATEQAAGTNLATQYKNLLNSVLAQGSAAYNTATSGENAYLGQRGLLSQQGLGNNLLSQAQNTVNTTNAANAGQVQTNAAQTQAQIAAAIAALQAGNIPQALTFGQNIASTGAGITNVNTQAAEALKQAQLVAATPFGVTAGMVFNPSSNTFTKAGGGAGGGMYGGGNPIDMARTIAMRQKTIPQRPPMSNIAQFVQ